MSFFIKESDIFEKLFPITYCRSVFEIIVGALSNLKRLEFLVNKDIQIIPNKSHFLTELKGYKEREIDYNSVVVFSNVLITEELIQKLNNCYPSTVLKHGEKIIGYKKGKEENNFSFSLEVEAKILEKPYDLIKYNKEFLLRDLKILTEIFEKKEIKNYKEGKYPIITNGDFYLEPNVFFDTREGPIFIGNGAYVQSFSRIEGPSYIGNFTTLITNSNIRRAYIGSNCIVGGEVSNSVILDYTNSRHISYIGDSYIGEWVNIGAQTVVSNIKNTYGEIKYEYLGNFEKTGMRKLGVILADHVKTSINALLFSGKVAGFSSQILFNLRKSIPSYVIWDGNKNEGYELTLNSAIETAKRFMVSRKVEFTDFHYKLFSKIFEITEEERRKANIIKGKFSL